MQSPASSTGHSSHSSHSSPTTKLNSERPAADAYDITDLSLHHTHVRELRQRLAELKEGTREAAEADAEADADAADAADADPEASSLSSDFISPLSFSASQSTKHVSIAELVEFSNQHRESVARLPPFVKERSNRDTEFFNFFLPNLERLLLQVPTHLGGRGEADETDLLASQRLAVASLVTPLPSEVTTRLEISTQSLRLLGDDKTRRARFEAEFVLPRNDLPAWRVDDSPTGSGKTAVLLLACVVKMCASEQWKRAKDAFAELLHSRTRNPNSGLCASSSIERSTLARLAIVFAPKTTIAAWTAEAHRVAAGARRWTHELRARRAEEMANALHSGSSSVVADLPFDGDDVAVWRGFSEKFSVELAAASKRPVLWVLPLSDKRSFEILERTPQISFVSEIYDEMSDGVILKYDRVRSHPLDRMLAQATPESLATATVGAPRNPIRLALNGNYVPACRLREALRLREYTSVQRALEQACCMRLFAQPAGLTRLIADEAATRKPRGLIVSRLRVRADTLRYLLSRPSSRREGGEVCVANSALVNLSLSDVLARLTCAGAEQRSLLADTVGSSQVFTFETLLQRLEVAGLSAVVETIDKLPAAVSSSRFPRCSSTGRRIHDVSKCFFFGCCSAVATEWTPGQACPSCGEAVELGNASELERTLEAGTGDATSKPSAGAKQAKLGFKRLREDAADAADGVAADAADAVDAPAEAASVPAQSNLLREEHDFEQEEAFEAKLRDLDSQRLPPMQSVIQLLRLHVELLCPSSRVLLCTGLSKKDVAPARNLCRHIAAAIPGAVIVNVETMCKQYERFERAVEEFEAPGRFPAPHIFLLGSTSSIQGLNLPSTQLTVLAANASKFVQMQALGRSLRMRTLPKEAGEGGWKGFRAKRIVLANME